MFSAYYSFFFLFFDSMARTKLIPKKDRKERWVLQMMKVMEQMAAEGRRPPSPVHYPSPAKKPSPMREEGKRLKEAERWVEEARQLEDVGGSLSLLPT